MVNRTLPVLLLVSFVAASGLASGQAASARVPTVDDLLNIKTVGGPQLSPDAGWLGFTSFARDGKALAFRAPSSSTLSEIYVTTVQPFAPRTLTSMTGQVAGFRLGRRAVISWKSKDGTEIEGVLVKPADFDPAKKYPLPDVTKPELPKEK